MAGATIGRPVTTGAGSRMLPLTCPGCTGIRMRAAFSTVARVGYPVCACGTRYVFDCPHAHQRYCDARGEDGVEMLRHPTIGTSQASIDRATVRAAKKAGGKRFQCGACSAFLKAPNQLCRCGYGNNWVRCGATWRDEGRYGQGGIVVDDIPF